MGKLYLFNVHTFCKSLCVINVGSPYDLQGVYMCKAFTKCECPHIQFVVNKCGWLGCLTFLSLVFSFV